MNRLFSFPTLDELAKIGVEVYLDGSIFTLDSNYLGCSCRDFARYLGEADYFRHLSDRILLRQADYVCALADIVENNPNVHTVEPIVREHVNLVEHIANNLCYLRSKSTRKSGGKEKLVREVLLQHRRLSGLLVARAVPYRIDLVDVIVKNRLYIPRGNCGIFAVTTLEKIRQRNPTFYADVALFVAALTTLPGEAAIVTCDTDLPNVAYYWGNHKSLSHSFGLEDAPVVKVYFPGVKTWRPNFQLHAIADTKEFLIPDKSKTGELVEIQHVEI